MLIWMFLHQWFPQSIDILLTNVNDKLAQKCALACYDKARGNALESASRLYQREMRSMAEMRGEFQKWGKGGDSQAPSPLYENLMGENIAQRFV